MATQGYKFKGITKHGGIQFDPGAVYGFDDPDAGAYFEKCGWAEKVDDEPAVIYGADEITIDPETRHNEKGLLVKDIVLSTEIEPEGKGK